MIDLTFFAHACISCAILGGLGVGWNALLGSLGGLGGVLSGPEGSGGAGQGGSGDGAPDAEPSRPSTSRAVPPPAYSGPRSSTITPSTPTTVTGPDGRTHYFDPNQPPESSGMNPPKNGKGTSSGGRIKRR